MLSERILKLPGFLYQIGNNYYYLGKWICKECTDQAATDHHVSDVPRRKRRT